LVAPATTSATGSLDKAADASRDHSSHADLPHLRPSLARLALATAELDGNDLAQRPELIERAAAELVVHQPDATPDDVLTYALGLAAGSNAA